MFKKPGFLPKLGFYIRVKLIVIRDSATIEGISVGTFCEMLATRNNKIAGKRIEP